MEAERERAEGLVLRGSRTRWLQWRNEGLELAERWNLTDNLMWANDYPHHEGTWPHSAQAIERTMGHLSEPARAKILGLNAARFFGFPVPPGYTA